MQYAQLKTSSEMEDKMPFLAGGYTQEDWNALNGYYIDRYFLDNCDTPSDRWEYLTWATKPEWCKINH